MPLISTETATRGKIHRHSISTEAAFRPSREYQRGPEVVGNPPSSLVTWSRISQADLPSKTLATQHYILPPDMSRRVNKFNLIQSMGKKVLIRYLNKFPSDLQETFTQIFTEFRSK